MIKILLASNNLHKLNEINSFFEGKIKFILPSDIGIYNLPEEDGINFRQNSTLKVSELPENLDLPILGDDSGLIVSPLSQYICQIKNSNTKVSDIAFQFSNFCEQKIKDKVNQFWIDYLDLLSDFPGVVSKRFGYIEDEKIRNKYLIELLKNLDDKVNNQKNSRWESYFETSLSLKIGNKIYHFEGRTEGFIIDQPRGMNGFGYDPIFYYPPLNKTFAELSMEEKNQVSHRSKALTKLNEFLNTEYKFFIS